jgi:cell division protein FtsL
MIRYKTKLVKSIRKAEKRSAKHFANMLLMLIICFCVLGGSGYYVYDQITKMEKVIAADKRELRKLVAELRNYEATQEIVEKADIELLNELLTNRVYWTKVLEAMAKYLPEEQPISYWITKFGYREQSRTFSVSGHGYITDRQEQLLALDEYLNKLRADPEYSAVFGSTNLRSATRADESGGTGAVMNERVFFEYISTRRGGER